tara:strand:- start:276 stop:905 length:630 start_codon:yes stop_codon:yes gene_type:complete
MAKRLAEKYNVLAYKTATKPQLFDKVLMLETKLTSAETQLADMLLVAEEAEEQMESGRKDSTQYESIIESLKADFATKSEAAADELQATKTRLNELADEYEAKQSKSRHLSSKKSEEIDALTIANVRLVHQLAEKSIDKPEIIPFFGNNKRSFQSSLALSWAEACKEVKIAGKQLKALYSGFEPRLLASLDSLQKHVNVLSKKDIEVQS